MIVETIHDCTDWSGVYIRSIVLEKKGDVEEQHVHQFDHLTYCGSGSAQYFEDGVHIGDVQAGGAVRVPRDKPHSFTALEDNTRLACIHDAVSAIEQRKF